ncbi:MAG: hypothetical protein H6748_07270 [Spirochaetaceae bacterium]|nr:hypothetical protein [Myxococcales bacterium]MCB9723826.1 hypothetical protein [Spirochaetaceae bacterium]HPG24011.1 hypothetical protein [Myxococcota bacterium]
MDLYHIWCNLRPGVSDVGFCEDVDRYLEALREAGRIAGHRITRRKLGLGPSTLGEFHVVIEVEDLAQLDRAFRDVSARSGPIEALHHAVNQHATDLVFALYRDFPDPWRARGEERF